MRRPLVEATEMLGNDSYWTKVLNVEGFNAESALGWVALGDVGSALLAACGGD